MVQIFLYIELRMILFFSSLKYYTLIWAFESLYIIFSTLLSKSKRTCNGEGYILKAYLFRPNKLN